jgi:hypothetical protein
MKRFTACLIVAACGGVNNLASDGRQPDAPAIDAGPNCMTDGFDGTQLANH